MQCYSNNPLGTIKAPASQHPALRVQWSGGLTCGPAICIELEHARHKVLIRCSCHRFPLQDWGHLLLFYHPLFWKQRNDLPLHYTAHHVDSSICWFSCMWQTLIPVGTLHQEEFASQCVSDGHELCFVFGRPTAARCCLGLYLLQEEVKVPRGHVAAFPTVCICHACWQKRP